jgi:hypothetical protein
MLSPADLLQLACDFTARVPKTEVYKEERNVCWGLICSGWLRLEDLEAALDAFSSMDEAQLAAPRVIEICKWIGAHLHSDPAGADFLRNTLANIARWEPWLYVQDTVDLVPAVFRLSGEEGVRGLAHTLKDGFTAASVLAAFAARVTDPSRRRLFSRRPKVVQLRCRTETQTTRCYGSQKVTQTPEL